MSKKMEKLSMDGFTPKEKRVALLLLYGKSRNQIAATMGVSENTVKTHTRHIFKKAGVPNQKALMSKYLITDED